MIFIDIRTLCGQVLISMTLMKLENHERLRLVHILILI